MATYNSLSIGTKGDDVKKLQQSLLDAGYSVGSSGADGMYGADTQNAVREYQKNNGLNADGIAGEETQTKLYGTGVNTAQTSTAQQTAPQSAQASAERFPSAYDPVSDTAYQQALSALQNAQKNAPTYANSYEGQLKDLYDQIVNRDKFNYDINSDALYQQYAQNYIQNGRLAMMDSMGRAAAMTGGYGSSYGQAVGQQQYNAYLQQLNDVMPTLYGQAYDRYRDEGQALMNRYAMLGDLSNDEYAKYQDAYNQWANERSYAQSLADNAYERGYGSWKDQYNVRLNQAETLAASGDFSGYAALYGDEAAENMRQNWISANPDLAYNDGIIDAEQYRSIVGKYPAGYVAPSSGRSRGGSVPLKDEVEEKSMLPYTDKEYLEAYKAAAANKDYAQAQAISNEYRKMQEYWKNLAG